MIFHYKCIMQVAYAILCSKSI